MKWHKAFQLTGMALILFVVDALLKAYVHFNIPVMSHSSYLYPYEGVGVFRNWQGIECSIVHVMNKGAAWGLFASLQQSLLYTRVAIIGGLLTYLIFVKGNGFLKLCLTLIVTGAIGNVIDYFVYGHVIDMFYLVFWGYSYPVVNIADSAIFSGIVLLVVQALIQKNKSKHVPSTN